MARAAAAALASRAVTPASTETRVEHVATGWEAPLLLVLSVLALSFGLVTVYSTSSVKAQMAGLPDYHYVVQQAIGGVAGLFLLALMANLDYRRLRLLAWPLLVLVVLALLIIVLPGTDAIAPTRNGARRWLYLGPVGVQPSEFAKLVLIVWTAALAVKKQDQLSSLSRGLLPFLVVWGAVVGLTFLQPSMSVAGMVLILSMLVLFAAGARIGHFLLLGLLGLPIVWTQVEGVAYRMARILTFVKPEQDLGGSSYQINQALIALGSGGIFGRGFGRGQQKFGFLPEPHNDFVFAMVGEEWGFAGVLLLILLFTGFALIGYRIARAAPDLFGFLLAIGCTNLIALQAFLHMGVNLALVPTTGITLPFLSYGRSSLLVCLAATGVLMNIARQAERRAE
jgi:cell division protein FtsW